MKRLGLPILIIIIVAVLVGIFALGNKSSNQNQANNASAPPSAQGNLPGLLATQAPWPANNDTTTLRDRLDAIGFPALTSEGSALHIHQHLDLYVNGKKIDVPGNIGIPEGESYIAVIHVHDNSGILHVESPKVQDYYLGTFFDVWGVKFDKNNLGSYKVGGNNQLSIFVNGQKYTGDPRQLKLQSHQEIVLAYGTVAQLPDPIPSSYQFPNGY